MIWRLGRCSGQAQSCPHFKHQQVIEDLDGTLNSDSIGNFSGPAAGTSRNLQTFFMVCPQWQHILTRPHNWFPCSTLSFHHRHAHAHSCFMSRSCARSVPGITFPNFAWKLSYMTLPIYKFLSHAHPHSARCHWQQDAWEYLFIHLWLCNVSTTNWNMAPQGKKVPNPGTRRKRTHPEGSCFKIWTK